MILRELFYTDPDAKAISNDMRYESERDHTNLSRKDTRKTRLTLKQINELRRASDHHILEQEKELEFIEVMYAPAAEEAGI
jgi:hypothetical protein